MKKFYFFILGMLFLFAGGLPAAAQHADLEGMALTGIGDAYVTAIQPDTWYLMYNRGRAGYACENGSNAMKHSSQAPSLWGDAASFAGYLVRFKESSSGNYHIETGLGNYFGTLASGAALTTTESASEVWHYGAGTADGYFYLYTTNENVRLDSQGTTANNNLVGWTNSDTDRNNREWGFKEVTLEAVSALTGRDYLNYHLNRGNLFRFVNKRYGRVISLDEASGNLRPAALDEADYSQVWIVESSGTGHTLRNASTGKYIQPQTERYTTHSTALAPATFNITPWPQNGTGDNYFCISNGTAESNSYNCFHDDNIGRIVVWLSGADPSAWSVEPVTNITADTVAARLTPAPADGNYYMILSNSYRTALTEENGVLTCTAADEGNLSQKWQLVASGSGYSLKNVQSGKFIKPQAGALSTQYETTTDASGSFTLEESSVAGGMACATAYSIGDGSNGGRPVGLHSASSLSYNVVGWYTSALASTWVLHEVEMSQAEQNRAAFMQDYPDGGAFRLKRWPGASGNISQAMADNGSSLVVQEATDAVDYSQLWILEVADGGYTMRNAHTGKYVTSAPGVASTPTTFYIRYSLNNTTENGRKDITISHTSDFADETCLFSNGTDGAALSNWHAGGAHGADDCRGSDWSFEKVGVTLTSVTEDEVKDHLNETLGHSRPVAGKYFRIVNNERGPILYENIQEKKAYCKALDEDDYTQVWTLEELDDNYAIRNAVTDRYIQGQDFADKSVQYTTEATPAGSFAFNSTNEKWIYNFAIADLTKNTNGSVGLHCDGSSVLVSWNTSNSPASIWHIKEVTVDEAALAAARAAYNESSDLQENAGSYTELLKGFFTDLSCTELKPAYESMDDNALRTAMSDLPTAVRDMAVKVKNSSWKEYASGWDKTEKTFRVASYKPYSDYQQWAWSIIKTDYCFGRLSNPTGIVGKAGDLITIYVAEDAPEGTELAIEAVSGTSATGSQTTLNQGLNTILCSDDVALYVYYNVTDTTKTLASVPEIKVHIEGGSVNGYFDLTKGDTNADWANLQQYLLKESPVVNLKAHNIVFCMNKDKVVAACPTEMEGLLGIWDGIVQKQHDMMRLEGYKDRFNCILNAFSITNSYMYATNYGTYYEESTLASVMNYENMRTNEAIWGPAHENGHIHQKLINMVGCTEISNNVFSNMSVYDQGYLTSRTDAPQTTLGRFNEGDFWLDHGTWGCTRLYWQLYLYYHVMGHKPDFYPELFKALRADPMNHSANTPIPASEDYLKFALKCCQVAGEDLTEFFEAYGFFVKPAMETEKNGKMCLHVGDYSNYYLYVDDDMIAETKAAMKSCGPANGNIIFIDDRIEPTPTPDDGERRKFDGGAIDFANHEFGEIGQYTDFTDENNCSGFRYTVNGDGSITVEGSGAVGIKVYDVDGNLVCLSNNCTFTLPAGVSADGIVVKAAAGNGEDVVAPNTADNPCAMTVYYGTADGSKVFYSTGSESDTPALPGNAVAVVEEPGDLPGSLSSLPNVVQKQADNTYKANTFVLTDKLDFYTPHAFTAGSVSYSRATTGVYNSVCLPFAASASDFGEGCKIFSLSGITRNTEDETFTIHFARKASVEPGEPCLVYCPDAGTSWNIFKATDTEVTGTVTPVAATGDASLVMQGSFTSGRIGEGKYKLNAAGTAFGVTTAAGNVTAFRIYIESEENLGRMATAAFDGRFITGIESAPAIQAPAAVYDLSGRRVAAPLKGGIYIVNGKKIIR